MTEAEIGRCVELVRTGMSIFFYFFFAFCSYNWLFLDKYHMLILFYATSAYDSCYIIGWECSLQRTILVIEVWYCEICSAKTQCSVTVSPSK